MANVRDVRGVTLAEERRRILRDVTSSLEAAETIRDANSRQIFLRELSQSFGGDFRFQESPILRPQLVELATRCIERDGGLRVLAECVELLEPGTPQTDELLRLADDWQATQLLGRHDIRWLRADLSDRPVTRHLLQFAIEVRGAAAPGHCQSAWNLFAHLASTNTAGRAPAWLRLLDLLVPAMSAATGARTRDLMAALSDEWGVVDQPTTQNGTSQRVPGSGTAYLVIQLQKYGGDDETYIVSHWHQWASSVWQPIRGEDRHVPLNGMEEAVDRIVGQTERRWASQIGPVAIEFVLPWQLLNEPVEQWRKEFGSGRPSPLTAEYPLVIRSWERLKTEEWHRLWRGRWQGVAGGEATPDQVFYAESDQAEVQLEALLKQNGGVVVLVLSESPATNRVGDEQLLAGLRSGVPAIIWHREPAGRAELPTIMTSMIDHADPARGIAELPRLVAQLRQSAWAEAPSGRDHIGHGLVILWDDPERQPELAGPAGGDTGEVRA